MEARSGLHDENVLVALPRNQHRSSSRSERAPLPGLTCAQAVLGVENAESFRQPRSPAPLRGRLPRAGQWRARRCRAPDRWAPRRTAPPFPRECPHQRDQRAGVEAHAPCALASTVAPKVSNDAKYSRSLRLGAAPRSPRRSSLASRTRGNAPGRRDRFWPGASPSCADE